MNLFEAAEAAAAKERGMLIAATNRAEILEMAQIFAIEIAEHRADRLADADAVYERLGRSGQDVALLGNAAGSIFRGPKWEFSGQRRKSARVTNHARWIMVWRLKS